MTIIRAYGFSPDAKRPTHYREAWYEEHNGELVVHHGKLGEPGTITTEKVADPDAAHLLLVGIQEQNDADGYRLLADDEIETFTITYRLKGAKPTQIESKLAYDLATHITRVLAWRGLGEVEDWEETDGAFTYKVVGPHRTRARKLIPVATKNARIQAARITVN